VRYIKETQFGPLWVDESGTPILKLPAQLSEAYNTSLRKF